MTLPIDAAQAGAYRARRYLQDNRVSLTDLVKRFGRGSTSWSLFLNGGREIAGGRGSAETILRERGIAVPPWLWDRETPETAAVPYGAAAEALTHSAEAFMEAQFLSEGARKRFGLFNNPFAAGALYDEDGQPRLNHIFLSRAHASAKMVLMQAATGAGFVAIYGAPGTGKSTLRARALADAAELTEPYRMVVVNPANIERRKMELGHVVQELLRQLTDDPIPQATNARDAKLEEVLLRYHKDRHRVVLLIEEAHELRPELIKDLKRLHEGRHGFIPLLGIILIGQPELRVKLDPSRNPLLTEVALRAVKVELPALSDGEVRAYLASRLALVGDAHVDRIFTPDAVQAVERLLTPSGARGGNATRPRTPLVINNLAMGALNCAHFRGEDQVTAETISDVLAEGADLQAWAGAA